MVDWTARYLTIPFFFCCFSIDSSFFLSPIIDLCACVIASAASSGCIFPMLFIESAFTHTEHEACCEFAPGFKLASISAKKETKEK